MFIANSNTVAKRIKKYYRRASHIVYPPVDTHLIKPKADNQGYFLVISRLSAYKRIDLAIRACNQLHLPLVIIGEGEQKAYLTKLAGPTVEILGWQSDKSKIEYLRNARALIFPGGDEDFGIVPVEAMAAGKPVIAFRKGGLTETVVEGKTGIFFDEATLPALISALRRFSGTEKKFNYKDIATHASRFSRDNFKQGILKLIHSEFKA
jgi:glycosyltransferase involved in cell wall biosynthesis